MKKHLVKLSLLALAVALIGSPAIVRAQDTASNAPAGTEAPVKKKKGGALPFHGKVVAVDTTANTVTVGKLTLSITEKTKIKKDGQTAAISDITVGETIKGAYKKGAEGKLTAVSINFGIAPKKAAAPGTN